MEMTTPLSRADVHGTGDCRHLADMLGRIGDRWTLPVVVSLHHEAMRFNQLRRASGDLREADKAAESLEALLEKFPVTR